MNHPALDISGSELVFDRTRIMGILNATPDSFSDGGMWADKEQALRHALDMARAGADIIDVGVNPPPGLPRCRPPAGT